jgi:purine-binding chemotaxis protein CheW
MKLYSAFVLNRRTYAVPIELVQEVVMPLPVAPLPLAPTCVEGLINLRGKITTSILLDVLFNEREGAENRERMNVVCRLKSGDVSLRVDTVEEVAVIEFDEIGPVPESIPWPLSEFLSGVCMKEEKLLCIISLDAIEAHLLSESTEMKEKIS